MDVCWVTLSSVPLKLTYGKISHDHLFDHVHATLHNGYLGGPNCFVWLSQRKLWRFGWDGKQNVGKAIVLFIYWKSLTLGQAKKKRCISKIFISLYTIITLYNKGILLILKILYLERYSPSDDDEQRFTLHQALRGIHSL